ncbi:hypothetical protein INT45_001356 [Circinella minor]|uniref:Uncharacterized protein n=1 Tax=Circinella minor TaxID=1195481 RepID=A0A8H7RR12_9FUNG|nr:hypothetical protein INT45_001356 [Circinella minor]
MIGLTKNVSITAVKGSSIRYNLDNSLRTVYILLAKRHIDNMLANQGRRTKLTQIKKYLDDVDGLTVRYPDTLTLMGGRYIDGRECNRVRPLRRYIQP